LTQENDRDSISSWYKRTLGISFGVAGIYKLFGNDKFLEKVGPKFQRGLFYRYVTFKYGVGVFFHLVTVIF